MDDNSINDPVTNGTNETKGDLSRSNRDVVKKDTPAKKFPMVIKYTAALFFIIIIFILFILQGCGDSNDKNNSAAQTESLSSGKRNPNNKISSQSSDIKKKLTEEEIRYNRLFTQNNSLESIIEKNSKPQSGKVISPKLGDTVKTYISFRWNLLTEVNEYKFTLVNNRNRKIWQRTIESTSITYKAKLDPGLYYWKVESSHRLETIGKFFVK